MSTNFLAKLLYNKHLHFLRFYPTTIALISLKNGILPLIFKQKWDKKGQNGLNFPQKWDIKNKVKNRFLG